MKLGDIVEVGARRYEVVSDCEGGVVLEPAITKTVGELREGREAVAIPADEFRRLYGPQPSDGEG